MQKLVKNSLQLNCLIGNKDKSKIVSIINEYLEHKKKIDRVCDLSKEDFEDMEITNLENQDMESEDY